MGKDLFWDSKNGSASDAKQRDPPRDEVRREGERSSSRRPQIAKQNRSAGEPAPARFPDAEAHPTRSKIRFGGIRKTRRCGRGGQDLSPAPRRARDLAKRGGAQ